VTTDVVDLPGLASIRDKMDDPRSGRRRETPAEHVAASPLQRDRTEVQRLVVKSGMIFSAE